MMAYLNGKCAYLQKVRSTLFDLAGDLRSGLFAALYQKFENIFPAMELQGLIPNFYIDVAGRIFIVPPSVLFGRGRGRDS